MKSSDGEARELLRHIALHGIDHENVQAQIDAYATEPPPPNEAPAPSLVDIVDAVSAYIAAAENLMGSGEGLTAADDARYEEAKERVQSLLAAAQA